MRFITLCFCVSCGVFVKPVCAELVGTYPASGGYITISPIGGSVDISGVELLADREAFDFGGRAYPFDVGSQSTVSVWRQEQSVNLVSVESFRLDGSLVLDVAVSSADANVSGGWYSSSTHGATPKPFEIIKTDEPTFQLRGSILDGQLQVSSHPDSGPVLLRSISVSGHQLEGGSNPAPFSQVVVNTDSRWNVASDTDVFVDGTVELDLRVSSVGPVMATVGNGTSTASLPIRGGQFPLAVDQQVIGTYPIDGGPISIQATAPTSIRQLQLIADGGFLVGGDEAAPFGQVTSNSSGEWVVESDSDVTVIGSVRLDVQAGPNTSVRGFALNEAGVTKPFPLYGMSPASTQSDLIGLFPKEGGPLTVFPKPGASIDAGGIDLHDAASTLSNWDNPSPFQFFVTGENKSSASNVTLGTLGPAVEISSPTTLDVVVGEDAELSAAWGRGIEPVEFPVFGGANMKGLDREPDLLTGSYPMGGGPVSIRSTSQPVALSNLTLTATKGTLLPGGDAAPFETIELGNADEWSVASSAPVLVDGEVTLDVRAESFSLLKGSAKKPDGKTLDFALNSFTEFVHQSEVVAVFPEEGGLLTLFATDGPVTTSKIEFATDGESVLLGNNPAPFDQFVQDPNNPGRLTLLSLSGPVTIDGPITLDVHAPANASFFGTWDESVSSTFPVIAVTSVPEPTGIVGVVLLASLLMPCLRARRKSGRSSGSGRDSIGQLQSGLVDR